ncbi:MAG: hypothetical protein IKZ87_01945 [Actinomycetaceae bacterium]|nr:hypothetical protein [Actinomycetaceae bacterium]
MFENSISAETKNTLSKFRTITKSHTLVKIAVGLTVMMIVLISLIFWRMIAIGREAATAYSQPSVSASAQATVNAKPTTQETPEMTLKEARERLKSLTNDSLCQGETDASFLIEFARLSDEADQWTRDKNTVKARLEELPEKCGETYTETLMNRLNSASTPSNLSELLGATSQTATDKRPVPQNAATMNDFSAPSRNIQCAFTNQKLSCTILEYDYTSETCQGSPITYSVTADGRTSQSCGNTVASENIVTYGTSVAKDGLACTITQQGIECWQAASGKGFSLSRSAISTF